MQVTGNQGKQAGFSTAIGAHDTDLPAGMDLEAGVDNQRAAGTGESELAQGDHERQNYSGGLLEFPNFMFFRTPPAHMRSNFILLSACLISGLFFGQGVLADNGPTQEQLIDWQERMERAEKLQAQGRARREEAEAQFASQRAVCETRFFVTACIEDARRSMLENTRAGRSTENTGLALAREVRKEQQLDRERRLGATQPARDADRATRAAAIESAQAQDEFRRREVLDDKASRAAEGGQRKQQDEARVARKLSEHAAKLNERRRAAEAAGKNSR